MGVWRAAVVGGQTQSSGSVPVSCSDLGSEEVLDIQAFGEQVLPRDENWKRLPLSAFSDDGICVQGTPFLWSYPLFGYPARLSSSRKTRLSVLSRGSRLRLTKSLKATLIKV